MRLVDDFVEANQLGEVLADTDTVFGEFDVRRPDIFHFSRARQYLVSDYKINGAPDLCVEVLSPSSIAIDRINKAKLYAGSGVSHYWIIDPQDRTFEAFELRNGVYQWVTPRNPDSPAESCGPPIDFKSCTSN